VLSEVGRRENNEDAVFASPRLAAVADGVGGAAALDHGSRDNITAVIVDILTGSTPWTGWLDAAPGNAAAE
jgi:serine/threonine protein phosphatase PrpC